MDSPNFFQVVDDETTVWSTPLEGLTMSGYLRLKVRLPEWLDRSNVNTHDIRLGIFTIH
jgi:hypothetical protein